MSTTLCDSSKESDNSLLELKEIEIKNGLVHFSPEMYQSKREKNLVHQNATFTDGDDDWVSYIVGLAPKFTKF
jgi:hypothetical protein